MNRTGEVNLETNDYTGQMLVLNSGVKYLIITHNNVLIWVLGPTGLGYYHTDFVSGCDKEWDICQS